MTAYDDAARQRLAEAVSLRRAVLGYAQGALPHGPKEMTVREIERAESNPRRKTLVELDRSLDWELGTSLGILQGTTEPPAEYAALRTSPLPEGQLGTLLRDAGVETRYTLVELAQQSRQHGQVPVAVWDSLMRDIMVWPEEVLESVAKTLQGLREDVTREALQRANLADIYPHLRHASDSGGDGVTAVKAFLPLMTAADKVAAVLELAQSLAADLPTDHLSEPTHVRSADHARLGR